MANKFSFERSEQGPVNYITLSKFERKTTEPNLIFWQELLASGLFDCMPVAIFLFDNDFKLLSCNRLSVESIRLYTSYKPSQALGMRLVDYMPGTECHVHNCMEEMERLHKTEWRIHDQPIKIKKENACWTTYWDTRCSALYDSAGRHKAYLVCSIDTTERYLSRNASQHDSGYGFDDYMSTIEGLRSTVKTLIDIKSDDRKELEKSFYLNAQHGLVPYIEKLKTSKLSNEQKLYVDMIEANLQNILSPLNKNLSSAYRKFTPTEIRIAELIKEGRQSKDISSLLHVSKECIDFHRNNIRKKLGLSNKQINLRSFLWSLSSLD